MKTTFRVHALLLASALTLFFAPMTAEAQKALVYCPSSDQSGCTAVRSALLGAFPGGVDTGDDGTNGTVDLKTVDLFQYALVFVPSLAETDSTKPYALLRDQVVADRLKLALLGRRAFWSGTPDQGVLSTTRPQKDALIQNLAAWASADFGTVNAPGLVVLQDNSDVVTQRYSWVQPILGFQIVADPKLASYSSVRSLTAAGNAILSSNGSTLAYGNMASFGFMTPSGASGLSLDAVGQTGTSVGGQIVLVTQMGANTGGAVITTDTDDYPPGTPVIMTGTGFGAGEAVTLTLHEDPLLHPDRVHSATAGANGGFVYSGFAPDTHDIDVRFVLTAKGQSSGRQAQTTFTDGQPNGTSITTVTGTVAPGSSASYTVNVAMGGNSNACTVTMEVTTGLPTGATGTFNSNPVALPAGSGSTNFSRTLTITTTNTGPMAGRTPPGTYTFTVRATAGTGCQGTLGTGPTATGTLVVSGPLATTLSMTAPSPASVTYGNAGPVSLSATLTQASGGSAVSGASVSFTVDGTPVGSATTNASGVATLSTYNPSALAVGAHSVVASSSQQVLGGVTFESSTSSPSQTLSVTPRAITVTADAKSKMYGDADPALTYQVTTGSLVGSDAFSGVLTRAAGTGVGSYAITQGTVALSSNYTLSFVGANLTIGQRPISVTADPLTKNYGDADPALTYQVTSGSLVSGDAFTGALTRDAGENIGAYDILQGGLTAGANYLLSFTAAKLTIGKRAVTVAADTKTKEYGDVDPALTYSVTVGSLISGDAFSGSLTRALGEAVGPYAITQGTLALSSNYALTVTPGSFTITARAITVTAAAKSKSYGDADPALTYSITTGSLIGTDAFTGALSRAPGENVGTYAINQNTLALSTNYVLTYVGASLTIDPRAITVAADAKTKVYGEADPALTYQITTGSLVSGDAFSGALTRVGGENVGDYAIQQGTLALGTNYTLNYTGANLSVTARPITITADAKSKTYGDPDPALTYQLTAGNLIGTDAITGALDRAAGTSVGTYAIGQGTVTAGTNYNLAYVGANLTINARPITVTADPQTKVYGDADPAPLTYQVTSGNLVGSDAFSGALDRAAGNPVGSYAIQQGTLTAGTNYNLTFVSANLSITARPITVTADAKTKVYGDADPALTAQVTTGNLVYGDVLSGAMTRASGENVGGYAIQQGALTAGTNYTLTYVGASLAITPRPITLKPAAPDLIWNGSPQTPAYSLGIASGSVGNGDPLTVFSGAIYSPMSVTNVGTYYPTLSGAVHSNYTVSYATGMFKVLDQSKPTGTITELLPIPIGGTPVLKVNFTDVTTGNSNIVAWQYRLDNAPYGATTIPVSPQSPNVNVQTNVVPPNSGTDVVQVCVQGQDAGGNWSPETCALLAIYDPTAGFVTGGGWIDSPPGAYAPDPKLTGKANFGFVSKYQKGATVPSGNTEFQFKEGNLNFKSTNFQWLVIQGTSMSQFKGTGTINGAGSYDFLVTANDGDVGGVKKPDSFRIKITQGVDVIYDNKMLSPETAADATVLGGGSIQIQSK